MPTLLVCRLLKEGEKNGQTGAERGRKRKQTLTLIVVNRRRKERSQRLLQFERRMSKDNTKQIVPSKFDVNAKWDACLDLTVRRFFYSSLGGTFAGLLFFRSPVTRWASVAFGAGLGIGSAYTDCSRLFYDSPAKLESHLISDPSASQGGQE